MDDLTGKVALVTGASRGIGRAIAVSLAKAGADVAVAYRSRDEEAEAARDEVLETGRRCVVVRSDVSVGGDVGRMVGAVRSELGDVSILVNNARISVSRSVEDVSDDDWNTPLRIARSGKSERPWKASRIPSILGDY